MIGSQHIKELQNGIYSGGIFFFWSPADFVHLLTDKEMISL